jgi:formate hydrogenlyase transcriptional activator
LSTESHFDSEADLQRYEALLEMADLGVHHQSLPELFVALAERLSRVAAADAAHFALYDPVKNVMCGHFWEKSGFSAVQAERLVDESPSGWAWQNQEALVVPDLAADSRFSSVLTMLREKGLRSYCWLPLTTAQNRLGALGLGSSQTNAYSERDLRLLPRVAKLVAVAVENALTREALVEEKERLHMLLEVNNTLVTLPGDFRIHAPHDPVRLRQRRGLRRSRPLFVFLSARFSFDGGTGGLGRDAPGKRHAGGTRVDGTGD